MSDEKKITLPTEILLQLMEKNKSSGTDQLQMERMKEDPFLAIVKWIKEINLQSGTERVRPGIMYETYKKWAIAAEAIVPSQKMFGEHMGKIFPKRSMHGKRYYLVNQKMSDEKETEKEKSTKKD